MWQIPPIPRPGGVRMPRTTPPLIEETASPLAVVEALIRLLVDHPEEVQVRELGGQGSHRILEATVNPDDHGQVIGSHGRNAEAIRTLLNSIGGKRRVQYVFEVLQPLTPRLVRRSSGQSHRQSRPEPEIVQRGAPRRQHA